MLLAAAFFFASQSFAQKGIELTAGYTPGLSFILNDNDFAVGKTLNYQATYGSQFGLTVGYNFTDNVGVATGLGFASINQSYISDFDNTNKEDQNKYARRLSYIRIPIMFRIGGDYTKGTSAYLRVGPHIDLLTSATGESDIRVVGGVRAKNSINYRDIKKPLSTEKADIFSNAVIGLTLEVGGRIRISDAMGVILAFHLESSLSNPEGKDARFFFANNGGINLERARAWNIMPGLNVSFQYVLSL